MLFREPFLGLMIKDSHFLIWHNHEFYFLYLKIHTGVELRLGSLCLLLPTYTHSSFWNTWSVMCYFILVLLKKVEAQATILGGFEEF